MQNNPTLTFDASEPLYNADFDELANATNSTRVLVAQSQVVRMMLLSMVIVALGMVFFITIVMMIISCIITFKRQLLNRCDWKRRPVEAPFILTQFLYMNERNYLNSRKAYVEINGTGYNSLGSLINSPKDSTGDS